MLHLYITKYIKALCFLNQTQINQQNQQQKKKKKKKKKTQFASY